MEIKNITVIGSGTMGNGIAHSFAQNGFDVTLCDVKKEFLLRAINTISNNLDRQVKKNILTETQKVETLTRIKTNTSFEEAAKTSDLVIEAVFENGELKKDIFKKLDNSCNESTILASNTSSISITEIAAVTNRPEKVIGIHFMNPVPMMKLVEIICGYSTSKETLTATKEIILKLEKVGVEVQDFPGFISNRILLPMINEAIYCVYENVSTAEAIDTVMKLGMNHPMGPLQLADFIGLDVCLNIMNVLYEGFGDSKYRACPLLKKMVAAGFLGKKSGKGFYNY